MIRLRTLMELFVCVLIMTVMVHTKLHAASTKTCAAWTKVNGPYTVKLEGKKWTCDTKRECIERETGLCQSLFGCQTTYITEYAECREANTNRYRPRLFDQGISPWIPHRWSF